MKRHHRAINHHAHSLSTYVVSRTLAKTKSFYHVNRLAAVYYYNTRYASDS